MNILNLNLEKSFLFEGQLWHCKFPTPNIDRAIDSEVSRRLGGLPIESIPRDTRDYTKICVTLNFVIIKKPTEYEEIRDFESLFNQEDFVIGIFNSYYEELNKFKEDLEEKKRTRQSNNIGNSNSISNTQVQDSTNESRDNGGFTTRTSGISDEDGSTSRGLPNSIQSSQPTRKTGSVAKVVRT